MVDLELHRLLPNHSEGQLGSGGGEEEGGPPSSHDRMWPGIETDTGTQNEQLRTEHSYWRQARSTTAATGLRAGRTLRLNRELGRVDQAKTVNRDTLGHS
jgi:hypothetical protein